ncbi:hypothetical protein ACFL3T_01215 [Patescibacteria group bacterium]
MAIEDFDEKPRPAYEDVMDQEYLESVDDFEEAQKAMASITIATLCTMYECETPAELVAQTFPGKGPLKFMEDAELFQCLPNYEVLVLKAVQSNKYAAIFLLTEFIQPQFFNMEFYDVIIEEATKNGEFPIMNESWQQEEQKRINEMKAVKKLCEEMVETNSWIQIRQIPAKYKVAASQDAKKLFMALNLLIEHAEDQLKMMEEIQKES